MRPSLDRVWQAVHDCGYEPAPIRRGSFMARCPSHGGKDDPNASFFLRPDGSIGFCCHSHQCHTDKLGWQSLLDELDLTYGDFYPNAYKTQVTMVSDDKALCIVAKNDLASGKKLPPGDMERYQLALLRLYGQQGAA